VLLLVLLPGSSTTVQEYLPRVLAIGGVVLAGLAVSTFIAIRTGLMRRLGEVVGRRPSLQKFTTAVLAYSGHYRLLVVSVLLSWLEQFAPIVAFALAAHGFGLQLNFLQCAAIIPLASVLERLPVSFAGLGVREVGIVLAAGWFGISSTESFLVSLFEQSVFILTMIPISLLYFVGNRK
jgi:glycosyltransferase 2 family protein